MTAHPLPVSIPAKRDPNREPVDSESTADFTFTSILAHPAKRPMRGKTNAAGQPLRLPGPRNPLPMAEKTSPSQILSAKKLWLRKTL